MLDDLVARLHTLDPTLVAEVVRQDLADPAFEIDVWSIRRLSDQGVMNADGLWLVTGSGQSGGSVQPWSVVVKLFARPEHETAPDSRSYWKREVVAAQSGVLEQLQGALRPPRFYRTDEYPEGAWLWMEHVTDEQAGPWTLDAYARAAYAIGRWNGAGSSLPLPAAPWFHPQPHRAWAEGINPDTFWQLPLHQQYLTADIRRRWEHLWAERERFYQVLEALPQRFAHFDLQRRNLFLQRSQAGEAEVVVIDWALCGVSPLGSELHALVGGSISFREWPSAEIAALDRAAFAGYVQGLQAVGWAGDVAAVRLAHVACLAIYRGGALPGAMTWVCAPESRALALRVFGMTDDDLYRYLLPLLEYWLACADEARTLMQRLRLP